MKSVFRTFLLGAAAVFSLLLLPAIASAGTYGGSGYGNCTYETNCATTAATSSSSTSSSSSSSVGSTSNPINLDNYVSDTNGYSVTSAKTSQVITFSFTNASGTVETHTITIDSITADSVVITLASSSQQFTLSSGQTITADLNGDGNDDVGVMASSITPPTSSLAIWEIAQNSSSSGGQTIPTTTGTTTNTPSSKSSWFSWTRAAIVLATLIVLVALIKTLRDIKNRKPPAPPSPGWQPPVITPTPPTGGNTSTSISPEPLPAQTSGEVSVGEPSEALNAVPASPEPVSFKTESTQAASPMAMPIDSFVSIAQTPAMNLPAENYHATRTNLGG